MPDDMDIPAPNRRLSEGTLRTVAYWVIVIAGSWWILNQLAVVMRPLLLAVFLGYVLLPYYTRLRKRLPAPLALGFLAGLTAAVLLIFALMVSASINNLSDELPRLKARAETLARDSAAFADRQLESLGLSQFRLSSEAPIADDPTVSASRPQRDTEATDLILGMLRTAANSAAGGVIEAATAALYLLFLLLGAENFPTRVRSAYPAEQAAHILSVAGRINSAIISYLKVKVKSSLILAVPVGIILAFFGVKFAFLWAVLTFLCNFIPYIGTVIAFTFPVSFAFLQLELDYQPITVAVLVLAWHAVCASVIEPMLIGRAVGLSPLVILAALSMWGLLWGLPGMFLAVPLTVVLKIVFENLEITRPIAKLLGG